MEFDQEDYLSITLEIVQMTDGAVLLTDGDITEWIPWSTVKDSDCYHRSMLHEIHEFEIIGKVLVEKGFV